MDWNSELDQVAEAMKPISEGVHTFRVVGAKPTKAASGNEMIKIDAKVEGGPDNGRTAITNLVFAFGNPKAIRMTMRRLNAFGITEETLRAENLSIPQIAGRIIGASAPAKVTHRIWQGEVQSDIDFMASGSDASGIPAAPTVSPVTSAPVTTLGGDIRPAAEAPVAAPVTEAPVATLETELTAERPF